MAGRLLTLTGARLSAVLGLTWDKIGEPGEDGASARFEDTKTALRTLWLGPEAARLLAALPRSDGRRRAGRPVIARAMGYRAEPPPLPKDDAERHYAAAADMSASAEGTVASEKA